MTDKLDVVLHDSVALAEVELMANLMIAANATDEHLGHDEIDTALRLEHSGQVGA